MTLVELVLVLVMASIVLALGIPSLQSLLQRNRLTAETNRFATSMMLARSEAVKRGTPTGIAATSGDWSKGWVVWVDSDEGDDQDPDELVLRTEEAVDPSLTLSSAGGFVILLYASDGTLNTRPRIAPFTDTLDVCDSHTTGETGRRITLAATGRVSVNPELTCP